MDDLQEARSNTREKLALSIREFRQRHHLKQAALAEMLKVTQSTISRWETGRQVPEFGVRRQLLTLLGLTETGTDDRARSLSPPLTYATLFDPLFRRIGASPDALHLRSTHPSGVKVPSLTSSENPAITDMFAKVADYGGFFSGRISAYETVVFLGWQAQYPHWYSVFTPLCLSAGKHVLLNCARPISSVEYEELQIAGIPRLHLARDAHPGLTPPPDQMFNAEVPRGALTRG